MRKQPGNSESCHNLYILLKEDLIGRVIPIDMYTLPDGIAAGGGVEIGVDPTSILKGGIFAIPGRLRAARPSIKFSDMRTRK